MLIVALASAGKKRALIMEAFHSPLFPLIKSSTQRRLTTTFFVLSTLKELGWCSNLESQIFDDHKSHISHLKNFSMVHLAFENLLHV